MDQRGTGSFCGLIVGLGPAEIQIGHAPNTSAWHFRYANLLGVSLSTS
jgi:hypothetical protein